jgi:DnaJ-class molecular chaperone
MHTHYSNLQVVETAGPEVIKGAYKALSQKWHPDRNPDKLVEAERVFKIITRAYEVLSDTEARAQYDAGLAAYRMATNSLPNERSSAPAPGAAANTSTPGFNDIGPVPPQNQASDHRGHPPRNFMEALAAHPIAQLVFHPPRSIVIAILVVAWFAIFGKQFFL